VVESPFSAVRLRTDAARRYKKVANAETLIWKILMIAEKKFRRLNAPELLEQVYNRHRFEKGIQVEEITRTRRAALLSFTHLLR
jgi:putative transposase